jgi:enoyl-CoA hydratase
MKIIESNKIAVVALDNPPVNALGIAELDDLENILTQVEREDSTARVLVFLGNGKFFGAGADLKMVSANLDLPDGADRMADIAIRMHSVLKRIENLKIPTIAILNGSAMGGGLELTLACDLRILDESAKYGLPEVKLGLIPGYGGTQRLTKLIGRGQSLRLILRGELISGTEAFALGIGQWVRPSAEVETFGMQIAQELAEKSVLSVTAIKECISLAGSQAGFDQEIETSRKLMNDPEARAGLVAFFAAKKP